MSFEKGMKKHPQSGIKKGSTHAVTFPKARAQIIASGKNPIEEVIKLIPSLEPRDQVKAWLELQTWLENKPKDKDEDANPEGVSTDLVDDILDELSDEQLYGLARGEIEIDALNLPLKSLAVLKIACGSESE